MLEQIVNLVEGKAAMRGSKKKQITDNTEKKLRNLRPFKPRQSGNPKGRPKGARNRLGTQFLEALEADFNRFGPQAIILMRERKPDILYPCCRRSLAKGGEHQPRS